MKRMVMVMLALAGLANVTQADEVKADANPTNAVPVVAKDFEETKVMTGLVEEKTAGGGNLVRVFIDQETGKRMVLPSHERQLPSKFTWGKYPGPVELKALLWHRVQEGKTQIIIKRILSLENSPATPPAQDGVKAVESDGPTTDEAK